MVAFAIGLNDEVTYHLCTKTGEVDLYVRHEDGSRLTVRFLEKEAVNLFIEALKQMQFSFKL